MLLVEAVHSPDSGRMVHHARSLESFCAQNGIKLSSGSGVSVISRAVPATSFPTPFTSPLFTGSFPSSPLLYSPDIGQQRIGRIDLVPPFSLDGLQPANTSSPPVSPLGPRQLSLPARLLNDRLQNSPQVGIVHLALQNDSSGSILSWQNDVFVVAEPGELADKFLQSVKLSLLSVMRSHRRVGASVLANISTMADLVACRQCFQIGGIVHRYIGRQTQVMEDDQEIGAYMFRRTVPSIHLTPDDVRHMVGAWRDRIIICTGTYGPTPSMIKAFLDSGSKAVICPSAEPLDAQSSNLQGSGDLNVWDNGKFEIGEEDAEDDEEAQPISPRSDWEDSDVEKNSDNTKNIWDDDEEELSRFVCKLYESIFQEGATVEVALRHALSSNRKLRYKIHLPRIP